VGLVLIVLSDKVVIVLIPECAFVVGGKVVVAIWALAGGGGDLDEVSIAIDLEVGSAEVCRKTKRAVESWMNIPLTSVGLSLKKEQWLAARTEASRPTMAKVPVGSLQRHPS